MSWWCCKAEFGEHETTCEHYGAEMSGGSVKWSEKELQEWKDRAAGRLAALDLTKIPKPRSAPAQSHSVETMNKTEWAYADALEARRIAGEIQSWTLHGITITLAPGCRYTPDFLVVLPDGSREAIEIKACDANGRVLAKDDSIVKLKTAAADPRYRYPWIRWKLAGRHRDGSWVEKVYGI